MTPFGIKEKEEKVINKIDIKEEKRTSTSFTQTGNEISTRFYFFFNMILPIFSNFYFVCLWNVCDWDFQEMLV